MSIDGLVIDPQNPSILYAGTSEGIYKSTDGAVHWEQISDEVLAVLAIDPQNSTLYAEGGLEKLYKTVDGGGSWTAVYQSNVRDLVIDPTDSQTLYIAGVGQKRTGLVSKSVDGGMNWFEVHSGLPRAAR